MMTVVVVGSDDDDDDTKKPKTALVPIANGSEEMETTVIVDVLRRAGSRVTVVSCERSGDVSDVERRPDNGGLYDETFEDEKQDQN